MKIGVGIKQEFKQAATLARQPGNAELSTNERRPCNTQGALADNRIHHRGFDR